MIDRISGLLPDILFYIFAAASLIGACMVLINRNPMTCAVSMVVSVLSIAILFVLLSAHFIAAAQMIVYAGAIVVLFIFVIMLLNLTDEEIGKFRFSLFKLFGAFLAVATLISIAPAVRNEVGGTTLTNALTEGYGSTRNIGRLLFGEYVLPFELTSVLILSAMVAGVVLAKKEVAAQKTFSLLDWILGRLK